MKITGLTAITLALLCSTSHAATITKSPNEPMIFINGRIESGDFKKFVALTDQIAESEKIVVALNTDGGSFGDGFLIANAIHFRGMMTTVVPNGECHSIGSIMWLSGKHRGAYASSHVSFHGAHDRDTGEVSQDIAVAYAEVGSLLGHLGLNYKAIDWVVSAAPGAGHYLTQETAKKYNIRYTLLSEEKREAKSTDKDIFAIKYTTIAPISVFSRSDTSVIVNLPANATVTAWSNESCKWDTKNNIFFCNVYVGNNPGRIAATYIKTESGEIENDILLRQGKK